MTILEANADFPTTASSSRRDKDIITLKYTWKIRSFNRRLLDRVIHSPTFGADMNDGIRWQLKLYPNGQRTEMKGSVSIFLRLRSSTETEAVAMFRILVLRCDRETVREILCDKPIKFKPGFSRGSPNLIKRPDLPKNKLRYFPDNNLTLFCQVVYRTNNSRGTCRTVVLETKTQDCVILEALNELYESKMLSDVVLVLNGTEFPAHKAILAARSLIFKTMFEQLLEGEGIPRVEIFDMNEDTLTRLLRFVYTGGAENPEDMTKLLATMDRHARIDSAGNFRSDRQKRPRLSII